MMSVVNKDSCSRIAPVLLPFIEQCLASEELNSQGGVLEIKRPRARLFPSACTSPCGIVLQ